MMCASYIMAKSARALLTIEWDDNPKSMKNAILQGAQHGGFIGAALLGGAIVYGVTRHFVFGEGR
jgi:hypothetical protein